MQSTVSPNGASPADESSKSRGRKLSRVRLRTEFLDVLMAAKGAESKVEHAQRFGIDPGYYSQCRRRKRTPSLELALTMAAEAGTTVETLFERAA